MFKFSWTSVKPDSIPLGCIPPAWKPYVFQFQLPPLDITWGGWVGDYHHQMSTAMGLVSQRGVWRGGYLPIPWCMWYATPPNRLTKTCENITFHQLRWWVIIILLSSVNSVAKFKHHKFLSVCGQNFQKYFRFNFLKKVTLSYRSSILNNHFDQQCE